MQDKQIASEKAMQHTALISEHNAEMSQYLWIVDKKQSEQFHDGLKRATYEEFSHSCEIKTLTPKNFTYVQNFK